MGWRRSPGTRSPTTSTRTSASTSGTAPTRSSATATRIFRTYFVDGRGDEALGSTLSYLDITALGRQEDWEDSPAGYPQTETPPEWWRLRTSTSVDGRRPITIGRWTRGRPRVDELRRRALAVAKGVAQAPFALLVLVFIVLAPAAAAIRATDWAFGTGSLVLETLVVVVLVAATIVGLWWSFATGGIRSLLRFGRLEPTLRASTLAVFATASFTSLTMLLHEHGAVGITPTPPPTRCSTRPSSSTTRSAASSWSSSPAS